MYTAWRSRIGQNIKGGKKAFDVFVAIISIISVFSLFPISFMIFFLFFLVIAWEASQAYFHAFFI